MANVQRFIDMGDEEFDECAAQAAKMSRTEPDKWAMFLHEDLIDATEAAIRQAREVALRQDPEKHPYARGFASRMQGVLAEITIHRAYVEEG